MKKQFPFFVNNFIKLNLAFIVFLFSPFSLLSQNTPKVQWEKSLGFIDSTFIELNNKGIEVKLLTFLNYVGQTPDDGYILGGIASRDYRLVKLDNSGNKLWDKALPVQFLILNTLDGGYLLGEGKSKSYELILSKVDSNFKLIWTKALNVNIPIASGDVDFIKQTSDGGFILLGNLLDPTKTDKSINVFRLDADGDVVWQKSLGINIYLTSGSKSIEQTQDGGFALCYLSGSNDIYSDTYGNKSNRIISIVKLDSYGNKTWVKNLKCNFNYYVPKLIQTKDESYFLAGYSGLVKRVTTTITRDGPNVVQRDNVIIEGSWIMKVDPNGKKLWERKVGKTNERLSSLIQSKDGGLALAGYTDYPHYNRKSGLKYKSWLIKLDSKGQKKWEITLSDTTHMNRRKEVYELQQTSDNGYILGGKVFTKAGLHGDFWVIKIGPE